MFVFQERVETAEKTPGTRWFWHSWISNERHVFQLTQFSTSLHQEHVPSDNPPSPTLTEGFAISHRWWKFTSVYDKGVSVVTELRVRLRTCKVFCLGRLADRPSMCNSDLQHFSQSNLGLTVKRMTMVAQKVQHIHLKVQELALGQTTAAIQFLHKSESNLTDSPQYILVFSSDLPGRQLLFV